MPLLSLIYKKIVPEEWRFKLYKFRHPNELAALRSKVHPSAKGDFSLAPFDEKKSIFVHITKTAGTSVALTLFGKLPYHYRAWQYRVIYGRRTYREYFKFAYVRNPWDRLYSAFSYLKGGGWDDNDKTWALENLSGIENINDFVLKWLTPERLYSHIHFWPQSDFICSKGNTALIDYLAYFETIENDFTFIAQKIGCERKLAHTNASKRAGYEEVYTPDAIAKVALLYERDIANFGYHFSGMSRKKIENGRFVDVVSR